MNPTATVTAVLLLTPMVWAQSSVYIPDAQAYSTRNNMPRYPFNASPGYAGRYQIIVSKYEFDNYPVTITGLGFVGNFNFAVTCKTIQVRFSYVQSTTLSTKFADNVGTGQRTVLDAREHHMAFRAGAWSRIGLQSPFYYIPALGNLAIDIIVTETTQVQEQQWVTGGDSFIYAIVGSYPLSSPATVGQQVPGVRIQLALSTAEGLYLGAGCNGSNGYPPALGIAGRPTLGGSVRVILSNAPSMTVALLAIGLDTRPPFPVDLAPLGMPGCLQYFAPVVWDPVASDARGTGQTLLPVPNSPTLVGSVVDVQHYVLDSPATKAGFTTTNYGRLMLGY